MAGKPLGPKMLEFWQWAGSDVLGIRSEAGWQSFW